MFSRRVCLVAIVALWLALPVRSFAADLTAKRPAKSDAVVTGDVQALATRIDQLIEAGWAAKAVRPAAPADDAEFLRRVYLDLAGRIPRVAEVHEFLDDKLPNKRQRLIERL